MGTCCGRSWAILPVLQQARAKYPVTLYSTPGCEACDLTRKLLNELGDPSEQYVAGDVVQFPTPDGLGHYAGAAVEVREDGAVLFDFNHPLAGQAVRFEVQLIGVLD